MDRLTHYNIAFRQGGFQQNETAEYVEVLHDDTLRRLTHMSFDRRLLKPILEVAMKDAEANPGLEFDEAVNTILDNKRRMLTFLNRFAL